MKESGKIELIFVTLILLTVFSCIPDLKGQEGTVGFLTIGMKLTGQQYCWVGFFYLVTTMQAYVIWQDSTNNRKLLKIYFFIVAFHFVEFFVNYTSIWVKTPYFYGSSRLITLVVFGYFYWKAE